MPAKRASAAALLAEKMLQVLHRRREQGDAASLTVAALAALADPGAGPRAALAVLRQRKAFAPFVIVARRDLEAPVALADDLPRLAGSPQLLEYAVRCSRTASNHVASLAEMKKKLTTRLQAPFQEALQRHVRQGTLPPTVGWLLIKGARKFFLLGDLHATTSLASPPTRGGVAGTEYSVLSTEYSVPAQPQPLPPPAGGEQAFARAFDEAFARLDRQAGGYNFVSLADLRPAVPCDRASFDAGLRALRGAGRYTLSAAEGRHGLTPAEREAGVNEDGTLLLFVSRRSP